MSFVLNTAPAARAKRRRPKQAAVAGISSRGAWIQAPVMDPLGVEESRSMVKHRKGGRVFGARHPKNTRHLSTACGRGGWCTTTWCVVPNQQPVPSRLQPLCSMTFFAQLYTKLLDEFLNGCKAAAFEQDDRSVLFRSLLRVSVSCWLSHRPAVPHFWTPRISFNCTSQSCGTP